MRKVTYTIDEKKYFDGKKISFDSLNPFQSIHILNDCVRHFEGESCIDGDTPCGVVSIEDDEQ